MPVINAQGLVDERVGALKAFHAAAGIPDAELDLSGGVDSGVMAGLLVLALGEEHVAFVHSRIHTNGAATERAHRLGIALHTPVYDIDLANVFDSLVTQAKGVVRRSGPGMANEAMAERIRRDPTVMGSLRSTLRAPVGRFFGRLLFDRSIRHGTGNECEDRFLRYYQKGGDGEVDTNPLANLSKTEVYQLAWALGERWGIEAHVAYRGLIEAVPSADLWAKGDEQTDERELLAQTGVRFTYGRIDAATGVPTSYGTIERVARFLDLDNGSWLVDRDPVPDDDWELWTRKAQRTTFRGFSGEETLAILKAARKAEHASRHKANPMISALGEREELVQLGLLSNDLD